MNLLVTTGIHFEGTPDGAVWARQKADSYEFWMRYLSAFDLVRPMGRVLQVRTPSPGWMRADGPNVEFVRVPCYLGPYQFVLRSRDVLRVIDRTLAENTAILLRGPCIVGTALWHRITRQRPYAVEVIGDPHDSLSPGSVRDPLRPLWRKITTHHLRAVCKRAIASAYVTRCALQHRYPPSARAYSDSYSDVLTTHYSSIRLDGKPFAVQPRAVHPVRPAMLISVGAMEQQYKAQDVLIEALSLCVRGGLDVRLTLVGDGKMRPLLEQCASRFGVRDRVVFAGHISCEESIAAELDRATIFVLPSLTEGLPRAMIEAMARGLPAIGSAVGGIPELIGDDCLVPPGNAAALAAKISEVLQDPARMALLSARNLRAVLEYQEPYLKARRDALYSHLRVETERWLSHRKSGSPRSRELASVTGV